MGKITMVKKVTPEYEELRSYMATPRHRWDVKPNSKEELEMKLKQNLFTLSCFDKDTPHDKKMRQETMKRIDIIENQIKRKGL